MAVVSCELYNSFPNIIEGKNNVFMYNNDDDTTDKTIVFPEGCYNLRELNDYIQSKLEEYPITQINGNVIVSRGIKFSKNESTDKIIMNISYRWKVNFANVQIH